MNAFPPDRKAYCIAYENSVEGDGLFLALDTISYLAEQAVDKWFRNNCKGAFCLIVELRIIPVQGKPMPFSYYEKEEYLTGTKTR